MVRTVFFALLLVNLAYFAWAHWVDVPSPPPANEIAKLPRLKLAEEVPPAERIGKSVPVLCLSVGPFADSDDSARVAGLLREKGFAPRERAEQEAASEGYWVYIGGLKSQAEADNALVALEHGGITDVVPMPGTPDAGRRLSLGMFSERARADRRAQTVHDQTGLKADVAERKLAATSYWIDISPPAGTSAAPLQQLLAEGGSSHVGVEPCRTPPGDAPSTGIATAGPPAHERATAAASSAAGPATTLR